RASRQPGGPGGKLALEQPVAPHLRIPGAEGSALGLAAAGTVALESARQCSAIGSRVERRARGDSPGLPVRLNRVAKADRRAPGSGLDPAGPRTAAEKPTSGGRAVTTKQ